MPLPSPRPTSPTSLPSSRDQTPSPSPPPIKAKLNATSKSPQILPADTKSKLAQSRSLASCPENVKSPPSMLVPAVPVKHKTPTSISTANGTSSIQASTVPEIIAELQNIKSKLAALDREEEEIKSKIEQLEREQGILKSVEEKVLMKGKKNGKN